MLQRLLLYNHHLTGKVITYFDLCPKTPLMFMNHYWRGVPNLPSFPPEKKLILMPNVEMYELRAEHYWRVDYVLCKTKDCFKRVQAW
jgi:hypothetical protein